MRMLLIDQAFTSGDEPGGTRHYELARHFLQRAGHTFVIVASDISYLTWPAGGGETPPVHPPGSGRRHPGVACLHLPGAAPQLCLACPLLFLEAPW